MLTSPCEHKFEVLCQIMVPSDAQRAYNPNGGISLSARRKKLPERHKILLPSFRSFLLLPSFRVPSSTPSPLFRVQITDIEVGDGALASTGKGVSLKWVMRRSNGYYVSSSSEGDGEPFIYRV